jgi:DNA polymerase III subunit gamma/tau
LAIAYSIRTQTFAHPSRFATLRRSAMSYTVLARKYRSANFDELVGQEHIAKTLKRAIETGRIAHAYLFCGTRGTGKTSTARILAKALNCHKFDAPTPTPCGKCDSCLAIARGDDIDVIEIDAASNTGVDNVREIIENAQYRPARSRFKVYIIDEVHMLSKSAFNALLKILEEPPGHVKFILATTEPEKVLPTILSRCQRYDFRNIPSKEIAAHLKEICKKEKISAADDALALVAKAGAGSMRDALSLLDRLLSLGDKSLSAKDVEQILGLPRAQAIFELVDSLGSGDVKQTLERADTLISAGLSADALIAALSDHLRNLLIALTCGQESGLIDIPGLGDADLAAQASRFEAASLAQDIAILEELRRTMRQNQTGRAMLDATLVRIALAEQFAPINRALSAGGAAPEKKKSEAVSSRPDTVLIPSPGTPEEGEGGGLEDSEALDTPLEPVPVAVREPPSPATADLWSQYVASLNNVGFASIVRMAKLTGIESDVAIISFPRTAESFVRQWSANGKKEQIARGLTALRGQPTGVRLEIDDASPAPAPVAVAKPVEPISEAEAGPIVQFVLKEFGGRLAKVE